MIRRAADCQARQLALVQPDRSSSKAISSWPASQSPARRSTAGCHVEESDGESEQARDGQNSAESPAHPAEGAALGGLTIRSGKA